MAPPEVTAEPGLSWRDRRLTGASANELPSLLRRRPVTRGAHCSPDRSRACAVVQSSDVKTRTLDPRAGAVLVGEGGRRSLGLARLDPSTLSSVNPGTEFSERVRPRCTASCRTVRAAV